MKRSFFGFIAISLCFLLFATGCDQIKKLTGASEEKTAPVVVSKAQVKGPLPANAVARVGGWVLTKDELTQRVEALKGVVPDFDPTSKESRALVVEELIRQQLIVEDAKRTGLANSKDIVDAVEEFKRTVIVREVATAKTESISVSDQEAQEFYDQNKELLVAQIQIRASEIVVEKKDEAENLLVQLLQGSDFAQLAKSNSISQSAENGGDLGFLTEAPFPEMASAIIPLEEGDVSGIFQGPDGFYIMKVQEKTGGEQIPFEDVKEDIIANQMMIKQQQAIIDYIEKLQKDFEVDVNEDLI